MFIATNTVTKSIPVPAGTNFVEVLVWERNDDEDDDDEEHWVSKKRIVNLAFAQSLKPYTNNNTESDNNTESGKMLISQKVYIVSFVEGCPDACLYISFIEEKPAKPKAVKTKKSNV